MPGTQLRFNCCYWATWRRVFKCLVNCWHLLTWVTILVENCERFNSIPALIIVFSFSDTEKRVLEHPSCILLLCHKVLRKLPSMTIHALAGRLSTPDSLSAGTKAPSPRGQLQWSDVSPFESPHALLTLRPGFLTVPFTGQEQKNIWAGTSKEEPEQRAHGLLSLHSPSPHKSWSFLLPSLRLLLCLPVSIHPLAPCYAKVGRSQPLLPSSHSELNLHQL